MTTDKTHTVPGTNKPLTSSFFRVERFRFHTLGKGMQRIITSKDRSDMIIPIRTALRSLRWFENINFGTHAADTGNRKCQVYDGSRIMHSEMRRGRR